MINGTDGTNKLLRTETRTTQAEGATLSWRVGRGRHSCHVERKDSLSRERDRDGPIREVMQIIAAQGCMNVI